MLVNIFYMKKSINTNLKKVGEDESWGGGGAW